MVHCRAFLYLYFSYWYWTDALVRPFEPVNRTAVANLGLIRPGIWPAGGTAMRSTPTRAGKLHFPDATLLALRWLQRGGHPF